MTVSTSFLSVSADRLQAVLEMVKEEGGTISSIAKRTGFSKSSITHALHELLRRGLVEPPISQPNPGKLGGQPQKFYVATGDARGAALLKAQADVEVMNKAKRRSSARASEKPKVRHSSGSGNIAPPVTIGRGFRWGSELV